MFGFSLFIATRSDCCFPGHWLLPQMTVRYWSVAEEMRVREAAAVVAAVACLPPQPRPLPGIEPLRMDDRVGHPEEQTQHPDDDEDDVPAAGEQDDEVRRTSYPCDRPSLIVIPFAFDAFRCQPLSVSFLWPGDSGTRS